MDGRYNIMLFVGVLLMTLKGVECDCKTVFPNTPTFQNCQYRCHCKNDIPCDQTTGDCDSGCAFGWMGQGCQYRNIAKYNSGTNITGGSTISNYAADGDLNTCARTNHLLPNVYPYWSIQWDRKYRLVGLVVNIRPEDVDNFEQFRVQTAMGSNDSDFNSVCYQHNRTTRTTTKMEIMCTQPVWIQHLRIIIDRPNTRLRLCEVEIYGEKQYSKFQISLLNDSSGSIQIFQAPESDRESQFQPKIIMLTNPTTTRFLKVVRPLSNTLLTICEVVAFAECPPNQCGLDCSLDCYCTAETTGTNRRDGNCPYGCSGRWTGIGSKCNIECSLTTWGDECQSACGNCMGSEPCNVITGYCEHGCDGHRYPPECTQECIDHTYGINCSKRCGHCKNGDACDLETGLCVDGCDPGWKSPLCNEPCEFGKYGQDCEEICGECKDVKYCNTEDGHCSEGCEVNWTGPKCTSFTDLIYRLRNNLTISMSSEKDGLIPNYAINKTFGTRDPSTCQCCSETLYEQDSWWRLDLKNIYPLKEMFIYGVYNERIVKQLRGFSIFLSNQTNNKGEHVFTDDPSIVDDGEKINISLSNHLARYVTVQRFGTLTLCNVTLTEGDCATGYYGDLCTEMCHCGDKEPCDRNTGHCKSSVCKLGWTGTSCNKKCPNGTFGEACSQVCFCSKGSCTKDYGICDGKCQAGYEGSHCNKVCLLGTFGEGCTQICSNCINTTCTPDEGICSGGCKEGFKGKHCSENVVDDPPVDIGMIVGITFGCLVVLVLVVSCGVFVWRKRNCGTNSIFT